MRRNAVALMAVMLALTGAIGAMAADAPARLDQRIALATSQSAIGRLVADHRLIDARGAAFSLSQYRGKPLVLSLVYTACSSLCPVTTQHLIDAVTQARRALGADRFEVLTVGFDARNDTPARLSQFAATQHIDTAHWRVASGDPPILRALLDDVGFSYAEVAGGFDHVAQTTIVDRDGRVYRQVYGDDFPPRMLVEPLRDAVLGASRPFSLAGVLDRIKFVCTTFDPGAGRYRIDYGLVFGSAIAALSLVVMGLMILREWRRAASPQRARALRNPS
jgi:protein SCO1/2